METNTILTDYQKKLIKRMRSGEPLTKSKTSGQFWIDSYEKVNTAPANGLIATGMIEEDSTIEDAYSIFYKLTERGASVKI
jgi:hypothetical protein